MAFQFITSPLSSELARHLDSGVASDHLILVGSQLMERTLRRRLQGVLRGPAPDIRVLANWLEEQAIVSGDDEPGTVVGPKDLELLLDHWLERREGSGLSLRFPDMISALSAWLAQAARGGVDVQAYATDTSAILRELAAFSAWLGHSGFRIRESLPGPSDTSRIPRIWLYQVDYLYPVQVRALDAFRDKLTVLLCTPEAASPAYIDAQMTHWGAPTQTTVAQAPPVPHLQPFPTPQSEVRAVMERLLDVMANSPEFRLTDAVVLVSDLGEYRPHIEAQAKLHGVPVQLSQGDTLRSNPILNRFNRLLRLRMDGFKLTDIMDVFGDALIQIQGLSAKDIRDEYLACLKRNHKTLREAEPGVLSALPPMFGKDQPRLLSLWCEAQLTLLRRFPTEADREVRTRKAQFAELIREFASTHSRLRVDPLLHESAFFRLFDQFLSGKRERTDDKPEALLFTEIHHFPDVHGKLAIVIGLADSLHPGKADHPVLNRFGAELGRLVDGFSPDPFLEARHHVERILRSADRVWMSYPQLISDARTTPGMLWTDLVDRFPQAPHWPPASGNVWELPTARILAGDAHAALIARIGEERRSLEGMGMYDGVLQNSYAKHLAIQRLMKDGVMPLSASRIELYARAPIDFFFKYVLDIEKDIRFLDDADVTLKGQVLHEILQKFHSQGVWPDEDHYEECLRSIRAIADVVMDAYEYKLGSKESPFPTLFRKQVHALLPAILNEEIVRLPKIDLEGFRPAFVELEWTVDRDVAGLPIRLNGKIDRVDVAPNGIDAFVIDYKTGMGKQPGLSEIHQGFAYQMAFYWLALKERGLRPVGAAYWKLPLQRGKAGMSWQEVMIAAERTESPVKKAIMPIEEIDALVDLVISRNVSQNVESMVGGHFIVPLEKPEYASDYALAQRFDEPVQTARIGTGADMEDADDVG